MGKSWQTFFGKTEADMQAEIGNLQKKDKAGAAKAEPSSDGSKRTS